MPARDGRRGGEGWAVAAAFATDHAAPTAARLDTRGELEQLLDFVTLSRLPTSAS